jgi:fermentation-respiration switch protein FrsA (DUF1100 family)
MSALATVLAPAVLAAGFSLPLLDRLIFAPDRIVPAPPPEIEERTVTTADGVRLCAWYAPARPRRLEASAPTLLWSHGNAGNVADRAAVQTSFAARGLNVLAYDYRGYGRSEGAPSEDGVYVDARAVYDSLAAEGVPASRIVCFGESLGGAVAIELALARACAGVAVVSTFTSIGDVARAHFGVLGLLATGRFDSAARIGGLDVPLFQAHGDLDEIVPFELGKRLFESAAVRKRFLRVAGAHHNDVFLHEPLLDAIASFATEVAGGPPLSD